MTFTALTRPLPLYPGEVTNTWHRLDIPSGPIAISEFEAEVVEKVDGETVPVPLRDAYLHHHVVFSNHTFYRYMQEDHSPMKPKGANRGVGFGAGTESRGTGQKFPHPYRFTTVEGEDELLANVHVINTRNMATSDASHCLECPCTSEDRPTTGDGEEEGTPQVFQAVLERKEGETGRCNADLVEEDNTSCNPKAYYGGLYCCHHGEYCLDEYMDMNHEDDEQLSTYYLRYTITYEALTPEVKPLYLASCCDASGNLTSPGNVEYDIPKCKEGEECIHVLETVQPLHGLASRVYEFGGADEDAEVEVVYMVGHLHRSGISLTSYFENGTKLCESLPTYGSGEPGQIGNEPGYINSMSSCTFDPPLRMKTTDKIKIVGKYNSTQSHTGVMSLFYIAVHSPTNEDRMIPLVAEEALLKQRPLGTFGRDRMHLKPLAVLVMLGAVVLFVWKARARSGRRREYDQIPGGEINMEV